MENTVLSRKEKERLRQRRDMLDAALSLFAEKGYHNVSMQEVAEKAEFAIGTLYKFFKNKEDLYKSIVLEQAEKFDQACLCAFAESDDEVVQLRNFLQTKGGIFRDNLPFLRLYITESRGVSFDIRTGLYKEVRLKYEHILARLASIFESGIRKKRFKDLADPYFLAVCLDGAVTALLLRGVEDPEGHPYPEDPEVILDILFQGLLEP